MKGLVVEIFYTGQSNQIDKVVCNGWKVSLLFSSSAMQELGYVCFSFCPCCVIVYTDYGKIKIKGSQKTSYRMIFY